jgi:hypothetical protein
MRQIETFFPDVVLGVAFSMLGSAICYLVFLAVGSICSGTLPHGNDWEFLPRMLIFEFPVGVVLVPSLRVFISNRGWEWAFVCFFLGAIFNPLTIILLLGFCGFIHFGFF